MTGYPVSDTMPLCWQILSGQLASLMPIAPFLPGSGCSRHPKPPPEIHKDWQHRSVTLRGSAYRPDKYGRSRPVRCGCSEKKTATSDRTRRRATTRNNNILFFFGTLLCHLQIFGICLISVISSVSYASSSISVSSS